MSDKRLRELERRFKETGDDEDAQAYLNERLRKGDGCSPAVVQMAKATAAMWAGKPLAEVTMAETIRALDGKLEGQPRCTVTSTGAAGERGAQGLPGDQLLLEIVQPEGYDSLPMNTRTLRLKVGSGIEADAYQNGDGVVELELSFKPARDRYGRTIQIGDKVEYTDEYGVIYSGEVTGFSSLDRLVKVNCNCTDYKESQVVLQGYELPEPPLPQPGPRHPSEADRQLRSAIELQRMVEDRPFGLPPGVLAVAVSRQGQLDVRSLGLDGAGRVISVGNCVRHKDEVYNVDELNIPGTGEGAYPTMRQVRIKRNKPEGGFIAMTVPELEIDYIDERDT